MERRVHLFRICVQYSMHNGDNHFWNCFVGEECNSTITCVLQNSILLDIFKHYDPHGCSFLWVPRVRVK